MFSRIRIAGAIAAAFGAAGPALAFHGPTSEYSQPLHRFYRTPLRKCRIGAHTKPRGHAAKRKRLRKLQHQARRAQRVAR